MRVPFVLKTAVAVFVAVLLCGCGATGSGHPTPAPDYQGSPVPTVTDSPVYPGGPVPVSIPVPYFGTPDELVGLEMENALGDQIGRNVPITPACDSSLTANGKTPKVVRCYARWGGVAVPFQVTVTDSGKGPFGGESYSVETMQLDGLLVATAVRTAWAQFNFNIGGGSLSCDKNLPAAQVVPFDKPTKYLCTNGSLYYSVELDHPYSNPGTVSINFQPWHG